jgi:osmotically-inducible protein OsmY
MKTTLLLLLATSLSSCGILNTQVKKPTPNAETSKTRTLTQTANDLRISAGIHVDLYCLELFKPVDVKVKNGVVYLTGSVPSLKESFAASGIAWKQNGVKEVVNNLKVDKNSSKKSK